MILLAVAGDGTMSALDNLRPDIAPWAATGYRLIARQTAADPNVWSDS
jgi:predicted transglutaminase-like cysteine proteinase